MAVPDTVPSPLYRGRFAPSPTGPLHAGSVIAALASYLDARSRNGQWLVRMEDLDPPRESREAAASILRTLERLGLNWDESVLYQSSRHSAYADALATLESCHLIFACDCSRQKLAAHSMIYPGTCRQRHLPLQGKYALRCRVPAEIISFEDQLQGHYSQVLAQDVGDFVIRRRDCLFAYQLAVVVDDAWQGVTSVVRGIDLLDSTPRQIYLQQCLGLATPTYSHIPVVVDQRGHKLSKQQQARAVEAQHPSSVLYSALQQLQQTPDPALQDCDTETVLRWASAHWRAEKLIGIKQVPEIAATTSSAV